MTTETTTETKYQKIRFDLETNANCCGIMEFGHFEFTGNSGWDYAAKKSIQAKEFPKEEVFKMLSDELIEELKENYGDPWDDGQKGYCFVQASIVTGVPNQTKPPTFAFLSEWFDKEGWRVIQKFNNVNSGNDVVLYGKKFNMGKLLKGYNKQDDDGDDDYDGDGVW